MPGSCRTPKYYLRFALLASVFNLATMSFVAAQSKNNFAVLSPERVVQLVAVERTPQAAKQTLPASGLLFTFRNVSNKQILEICISPHPAGFELDCLSGFANGAKLTDPGDTFSMTFEAGDFPKDVQQQKLIVNAILYGDGSHIGQNALLAKLASRMVGAALETKRISDLLFQTSDDTVAGLDSVLQKIGTDPTSSRTETITALKGESLPGISPLIINGYLPIAF
jgi:hypothetical protein